MRRQERIVTVFGSSQQREGDAHYTQAQALGVALANKRLTVCSGGYGGVMEAVSRGAKAMWGESGEPLVHVAPSPADAASYLAERFQAR